MFKYPSDEQRFWNNVPQGSPYECWEWKGTLNAQGYGVIRYHGKNQRASRIMYELHNSPIGSSKIFVLHSCDNRKCINPSHLSLGTPADNMKDMVKRERSLVGEQNHKAHLTANQVLEIRASWEKRELTQFELADKYAVDQTQISRIVLRKQWKHI